MQPGRRAFPFPRAVAPPAAKARLRMSPPEHVRRRRGGHSPPGFRPVEPTCCRCRVSPGSRRPRPPLEPAVARPERRGSYPLAQRLPISHSTPGYSDPRTPAALSRRLSLTAGCSFRPSQAWPCPNASQEPLSPSVCWRLPGSLRSDFSPHQHRSCLPSESYRTLGPAPVPSGEWPRRDRPLAQHSRPWGPRVSRRPRSSRADPRRAARDRGGHASCRAGTSPLRLFAFPRRMARSAAVPTVFRKGAGCRFRSR